MEQDIFTLFMTIEGTTSKGLKDLELRQVAPDSLGWKIEFFNDEKDGIDEGVKNISLGLNVIKLFTSVIYKL